MSKKGIGEMVSDGYFDDFYYDGYEYSEFRKDTKIDEAKERVKRFFKENKKRVCYMKQLEVMFEKTFFHWITARALGDLIDEEFLKVVEMPLAVEGTRVKFLFDPQNRYYKRPIKKSIDVIKEYSDHVIARGCGEQADLLFFNALISRGFISHGQDTNEFGGKKWEISNHNLDFIIERDSIQYGCEVKNTFDYIDREELLTKLRICEYLKIKPLFIMRYSPKSYNHEVIERGGYVMIFEKQIYPFGHEKLVNRITEVLGMPVDCPRKIPDGIIDRFVKWHGKR